HGRARAASASASAATATATTRARSRESPTPEGLHLVDAPLGLLPGQTGRAHEVSAPTSNAELTRKPVRGRGLVEAEGCLLRPRVLVTPVTTEHLAHDVHRRDGVD